MGVDILKKVIKMKNKFRFLISKGIGELVAAPVGVPGGRTIPG